MDIIKCDVPWEHYEINNFLNIFYFQKIKKLTDKAIRNGYIGSTKTIQYNLINEPSLYNIILSIFKKLILKLNKKFYDSSVIKIKYNICKPNHTFEKIHTDIKEKKYAGILYVSDVGKGTELYSQSENIPSINPTKIVEWKPNKLIFFERTDNTWHYYDNQSDDYRVCLNINVYTS